MQNLRQNSSLTPKLCMAQPNEACWWLPCWV